MTTLAAPALALFVTTSFLCAAVFVLCSRSMDWCRPVWRALPCSLSSPARAGTYMVRKRQIQKRLEARAAAAAKSAAHSALADPCWWRRLQVVRAIGIKKLIPILAWRPGAGFLASRNAPATRRRRSDVRCRHSGRASANPESRDSGSMLRIAPE